MLCYVMLFIGENAKGTHGEIYKSHTGNWLSQIEKHVVVCRLLSDYWEGVWGFKSPF